MSQPLPVGARLLYALYAAVTWLVAPAALLVGAVHALLSRRQLDTYLQRLTLRLPPQRAKTRPRVWIHAVNIGEVLSSGPLIRRLEEDGYEVWLSTLNRDGQETARKNFPHVPVFQLPLDYAPTVRRALSVVDPDAVLLVEVEIWPMFVRCVKGRGLPLFLVSGRMPPRDFTAFCRARFFFRHVLNQYDGLLMQSEADAERMRRLCDNAAVETTGSLKFDVTPVSVTSAAELLPKGYVLCAVSTHDTDHALVVGVYESLAGEFPDLRLVVAPKHPEEAAEIARLARAAGMTPVCRTEQRPCSNEVFVLDTVGELIGLLPHVDLVIMGGSFSPDIGGHNLIEPALYGKCVVCGPHMEHFEDTLRQFVEAEAVVVTEAERLRESLRSLLTDRQRAAALGARAREVVALHRGAADRTWSIVASTLRPGGGAPH